MHLWCFTLIDMDGHMLKKYLVTPSQHLIFMTAFLMVLLFNQTFFTKLASFAWEEKNYTVLFSAPLVLMLLFVAMLNLLVLVTHRHSFKGVLALVLVIGAISSYFMDSFGTIIDKEMFNNMAQTDSAEVLDLFTPKLFLYVMMGAVLPVVLMMRYHHFEVHYGAAVAKRGLMVLLCVSLIVVLYGVLNGAYGSFFRSHKELRMYLNPIYPVSSFVKFVKIKAQGNPVFTPIALDAHKRDSENKKLVILVVGETARAENFSLNGYTMPTSPLLQSRDDIVAFSNFYSCGTVTAVSVPCMFSKFSRTEFGDDKNAYENLVDVVQKVGVRVVWRDNNSGGSKGVANRVENAKYYGGKTYDEVLLEDLQSAIDEKHEDTLIVLHQEGSHGPTYFKRYPETFKKFTPACDTQDFNQCSQEQIINSYNNTLLYTDFVVNEAIELLKKNESKYETTLLYVSDHGESLGENGVYLHGIPYFMAPDAQKHVPALFYFGEKNHEKLPALHAKKTDYFSHDNVFHTMLGLFDIKTNEYNTKLDMLVM